MTDSKDFFDEFANILGSTDLLEMVTFHDSEGIFLPKPQVEEFLLKAAEYSKDITDLEKRKVVTTYSSKLSNLKKELEAVNKVLQKTEEREDQLLKDLEPLEESLAKAKQENLDFQKEFQEKKTRYLDLIRRYEDQVKVLKKTTVSLSSERELKEIGQKAKEAQENLKNLKKEKGNRLAEIAVLKLRITSYRKALEEEGQHHLDIRNQYEQSLKNSTSFSEIARDYSDWALRAFGMSKSLNSIWFDKLEIKEKAWSLIELAKAADPKNKIGARDLATKAFQTTKKCPYNKRHQFDRLIKETSETIALGNKTKVELVSEKWSKIIDKRQKLAEEHHLENDDITILKEEMESLEDDSWRHNFVANIKTLPGFLFRRTKRYFSSTRQTLSKIWNKITSPFKAKKPNVVRQLVGYAWSRFIVPFKTGHHRTWNKIQAQRIEKGLPPQGKVYSRNECDLFRVLADQRQIPYESAKKIYPEFGVYESKLPKILSSEWELLDSHLKGKEKEQLFP